MRNHAWFEFRPDGKFDIIFTGHWDQPITARTFTQAARHVRQYNSQERVHNPETCPTCALAWECKQ